MLEKRTLEGEMPSLGGATGWLNSPPLSAGDLRGKVILINFCTYTCIYWIRSLPYVRAWAEHYRERGLVVIGVHTPEFAFEHDLENVRRAVQDRQIMYPMAIDNDYAIWRAFNNHYWPAIYVVDAEGRLRYQHFGEGLWWLLCRSGGEGVDLSGKLWARKQVLTSEYLRLNGFSPPGDHMK